MMDERTHAVIGCCYTVANTLGCGFLEKVYENALMTELKVQGIPAVQQHPVTVYYRDVQVGRYIADILVDEWLIIEIKVSERLHSLHVAQCLNYLRATGLDLALLVNFGTPRIEVRRIRGRNTEPASLPRT